MSKKDQTLVAYMSLAIIALLATLLAVAFQPPAVKAANVAPVVRVRYVVISEPCAVPTEEIVPVVVPQVIEDEDEDEDDGVIIIITKKPPEPPAPPEPPEPPTPPEHHDHGNHYGNDRPDNNPRDVHNRHNGIQNIHK